MPTYVYECSKCSSTFEIEQRITENPLTSCHCGSEGTVKRLIQPTAIMFKGSGFHINDYQGSGASKSTSTDHATPESCTGDQSSCACSTEN
jgi:putative FmdB family regulatory protein